MNMPNITQLNEYGQTALAAYAQNLVVGNVNNASKYKNIGMADAQARGFDAAWVVLQQSPSDPVTGFSAVLLQRKDANGNATGEKVLAIAGTDPSSPTDIITDLVNVAYYGTVLGMPQYGSLESFYSQLVSAGLLGATEQITVTGHSLGGFLAQAFTARHTGVVAAAYTYNAPGFGTFELLLGFLGVTDTTGAASKITNVYATDGLSMTAGLGFMLGSTLPVRIENNGITGNHSIVRLSDTLAVYETYARLTPGLDVAQAAQLFSASGSGNHRQEDALDALRNLIQGKTSVDKTAVDNHDAFGANLAELQNSSAFASLAGKVTLNMNVANIATQAKARVGFEEVAALETLSPFVLNAAGSEGATALQALWGSGPWLDKYQGWQADKTALQSQGTPSAYTDNWIADRSSLLQGLIIRNTYDLDSTIALKGTASANYTYTDLASAQTVLFRGTANTAYGQQAQQVTFGNDLDNSLNGSDAISYGNGDRLYGGKGNDSIDAKAGDDYLEGNSGDDTLIGGAGNDTLLGGAGADTYQFTGAFGHDTVLDAGGSGTIRINTDVLDGGIKVTDTIWESADKKYIYVVVGADLIIGQRTTAGAPTVTDTLTIKNWHASELGLTPQTAASPAPAPQSHLTVYQAYSPAANDQGSVTEVIDGQSTSTPSGADYTVARTTTTGLASITNSGTDNIITIRKLNQAEAQSSVAKLRNIDKWNWIRMHRFDRRCFAANEGSFICVA
jgi:pimeloyl-ACP methyl ester carboxylesterase